MRYVLLFKNDAFINVYSQDHSSLSFDSQNNFLNEIFDRFMFIITQNNDYNIYSMRFSAALFDQKMMLFQNDRRNDYRNIDYRTLFNNHYFVFQLNYAKSKQTLRDVDHIEHVRFQRKYDFNDFIIYIIELKILRRDLFLF